MVWNYLSIWMCLNVAIRLDFHVILGIEQKSATKENHKEEEISFRI